jgi:uncharacterized protein (DUF302 family)
VFGTALIVLGVIVNIASAWRHVRLIRELKRGEPTFARPSQLAVAIALILAALGLAMAIDLLCIRQPRQTSNEKLRENSMTAKRDDGLITLSGRQSVDQTVQKLEAILETKGVKLFALIDHSGEAEKAGMKMRPTKLLIFGSPKGGTPLMIASPTVAIDLPLKILVWEDADGKVQISYNSPAYLQERHDLPPELVSNIAAVEVLAKQVAE